MKLSRHIVRVIVALIVAALAGMTYLQYRLLANTIELKETTFRHNVTAALNFANEKLEEIDARNRLFFNGTDTMHTVRGGHTRMRDTTVLVVKAFGKLAGDPHSRGLKDTLIERRLTSRPQRVTVRTFNMLGDIDTTIVDTFTTRLPGDVRLPKDKYSSGVYFVQVKTDSATSTVRLESGRQSYAYTVGTQDIRKDKVIKRIAESIGEIPHVPLSKRFTRALVDSVISAGLAKQGIGLAFDFGLFSNDSLSIGRTSLAPAELLRSEYRLRLVPLEPSPVRETMAVAFPSYRAYMLTSLLPELGASLALTAVIVFCFAYTISIIIRQKRFAERLSEFINNMTHEFKTPLSTISLASEALARTDVKSSESKIDRYNQVIRDEHARMRNQVDKILQMAALEEHETEFEHASVDLHAVIERAAAQFSLLVRSRNGSLTTELAAHCTTVTGDTLHIENVIRNLLDNAVKYSASAPVIRIRTSNERGKIVVSIGDKGIGMAREHHKRVFEKYFRIPTGNLHDVKGFGLGLSYVKLVTEAHAGSVSIDSAPDRGTVVTLRFPCVEGRA